MRGAVWLLVRAEIRRRWKGLTAVGLLSTLVLTVVMAAMAGARRTASAYDRFRDATLSDHVSVELPEDGDADLVEYVGARPEVEAIGRFAAMVAAVDGSGLVPGIDMVGFVAADAQLGIDVSRPRVVRGRAPRSDRPDEILLSPELADRLSLSVGDRFSLVGFRPDQMEAFFSGAAAFEEPESGAIPVTLVGVGYLDEMLTESSVEVFYAREAFYRAHRDRLAHFDQLHKVRLHEGLADVAAFREGLERLYDGDAELFVESAAARIDRVEDALAFQARALRIFAALAAAAGMVLIVQSAGRQALGALDDAATWRAVGLTRRQRLLVASIPTLLVASLAAGAAAAGAVIVSPLLPFGFARRVEPSPGFDVDVSVLVLGAVVGAASVTVAMVTRAWWRARSQVAEARAERPSRVVASLSRSGLAPAALAGARMAFERGRGRTSVPVRAALVGASAGVAGLVAAIVFGASLARLVDSPGRFGAPYDAEISPGDYAPESAIGAMGQRLAADDRVEAATHVLISGVGVGPSRFDGYGFDPVKGERLVTIIQGRAPASDREVALGASLRDELRVEVGDTIVTQPGDVAFEVVGVAVLPIVNGDDPAGAAAFTRSGLEAATAGDGFSTFFVRWTGAAAPAGSFGEVLAVAPRRPASVANIAEVRSVPFLLAGFIVVVTGAMVSHALVVAVRRRRRDLAILRVLGLVRRDVRVAVTWQATLFAVSGLVIGIPLGVVAGRWAWALVADGLGMANDIAVPGWMFFAIPVTVAVANLVAVPPGRAAARTRPAVALRTE